MQIIGFRRFQATRQVAKTRVVDEVPEGFAPDFSLADAGMAIHSRAEVGLGIVEVNGQNLVQAQFFGGSQCDWLFGTARSNLSTFVSCSPMVISWVDSPALR